MSKKTPPTKSASTNPAKLAKSEIVDICQSMVSAGLVIGTAGNVSQRIGDTDTVAITPSSKDYSCLDPNDIMVVTLDAEVLEGDRNPSTETPMHLTIYKARPDVSAVIHTHSVYASALAVLRIPLPPIIDEFVVRLGGQVEVAKYAMPGTEELARNAVEALGPRNGVLLANHGPLCCAGNLHDALHNAQLLERAAHIYLLARAAVGLKKVSTISPEAQAEQQSMFEMFKRVKRR
jgi:ribulose-5-phosphate 4-epimerase/fuculose-1-phosphate aldolase